MSTVNAVTWSLEIEIQFYIVAPFLARYYFRSDQRHRRIALACGIGAWMFAKTAITIADATRLRLGLLFALDHFLTGILLADIFVFKWREAPQQGKLWDLLGLVIVPAIFLIQLRPETLHVLPVLTALLFAAALRGPITNRILSVPLIVVTGGMCYSIYLYHFFVISFLGRFITPLISSSSYLAQLAITSAIIIPAIFFACAFFFVAIEKPFMKWRPLRKTESLPKPEDVASDLEPPRASKPVTRKAA